MDQEWPPQIRCRPATISYRSAIALAKEKAACDGGFGRRQAAEIT
jgi:hypothetical protein